MCLNELRKVMDGREQYVLEKEESTARVKE